MLALPPSPGPVLGFGVDTFAFRNDSRIHHRGKPDIYCNRCFLMARAVGQFQRFARFAADETRLTPVRFDGRDERFHPAPLCGVSVPRFRAFRQYYSPLF